MRTLLRLLLCLLLGVVARADQSLLHARRAQALLGRDVWSRVVRVDNSSRVSPYPATVHALVFEFLGRLWFYTDSDGTQSFSLHAGRLEAEKADFGPLLRDIDPGFRQWTLIAPDATPAGQLANGCFVESVALLQARLAAGAPIADPQLLSYYIETARGQRGHTVLVYRDRGNVVVCDPARPKAKFSFAVTAVDDALEFARQLEGPAVVKARYLHVPLPAQPGLA